MTVTVVKNQSFLVFHCVNSAISSFEGSIFASNFFANDEHSQRNIRFFFHMCSPYFLSEHCGVDDMMTSRTTWGLACDNILFE